MTLRRNEKDSRPLMHAEISIKKDGFEKTDPEQIVKVEKLEGGREGGCDYSPLLWDRRNTGASPK